MKRHTKNKTELAKECGFKSRVGLYGFMRKPGWPKETADGWDIEECRAFVLANTEKEAIAATLDSEINDLKKWDIYERARKSKIANDLKEGKLIPRAEHENQLRELVSECQKVLYQIPTRAPELAGLATVEIERRLVSMIDEAITTLRGGA